MNRRQKIIISVTGIFLVLLILVGLTYAYYSTQIQGNDETRSISVTTAKLELVYGDNSEELIKGNGALVPSKTTEAEDAIGTKTFTVTNNGNYSSYVVIIDNVSVTKASDGSATTFESNDFRYTLSCSVKDKSGNLLTDEKCNDVKSLSTFPINGGILVGNAILENRVHEYTLTMWYIDNGEDQSDDMNKHLQARVNIADVNQMENPFKTGDTEKDNASLAYNIIENAKTNKNGTRFVNTPPSKVAEEISLDNWDLGVEEKVYYNDKYILGYAETEEALWDCYEGWIDEETGEWMSECSSVKKYTSCTEDVEGKYVYNINDGNYYVDKCADGKILKSVDKYEKVLSSTIDDYGTSYYFRGNVEDNYVNFAGMCWRIVRIAGDGSTKLILEDQYTTCNDNEDTDDTGTTDYKYTGNWFISSGNYGRELKDVDGDGIDNKELIMNYLKPVTNKELSMVKSFYDFQTTKLKDYTSKLKAGDWCLSDTAYIRSSGVGTYNYIPLEEYNYLSDMYYDAYIRLASDNINGYQPTLKCNGTILNKFEDVTGVSSKSPMYVATLTADEIVFAGGKYRGGNDNYYLMNGFLGSFWLLSPNRYILKEQTDNIMLVSSGGSLYSESINLDWSMVGPRPSISLLKGITISGGEGTLSNPYVISE